MAQASRKHFGAGAQGKGDGTGAMSDLEPEEVPANMILSNRDKAGHSETRGPEYLLRVIKAPFTQAMIDEAARSSAIRRIATTSFGRVPVPIPPYDDQAEMDRRVDELMGFAATVQTHIHSAARRVDRSSRAVLAKDFRGELAVARGAA